jgi:hypothetical protein
MRIECSIPTGLHPHPSRRSPRPTRFLHVVCVVLDVPVLTLFFGPVTATLPYLISSCPPSVTDLIG